MGLLNFLCQCGNLKRSRLSCLILMKTVELFSRWLENRVNTGALVRGEGYVISRGRPRKTKSPAHSAYVMFLCVFLYLCISSLESNTMYIYIYTCFICVYMYTQIHVRTIPRFPSSFRKRWSILASDPNLNEPGPCCLGS